MNDEVARAHRGWDRWSWNLLARWVVATVAGAVLTALLYPVADRVASANFCRGSVLAAAIIVVAFWAVVTAAVQSIVLWRYVQHAGLWIPASVGGWFVGYPLGLICSASIFFPFLLAASVLLGDISMSVSAAAITIIQSASAVLVYAILYGVVGWAQARVLRRSAQRTRSWIITNAAFGFLFGAVALLLAPQLGFTYYINPTADSMLGGGSVAKAVVVLAGQGASYGLVTGIALVNLLRPRT